VLLLAYENNDDNVQLLHKRARTALTVTEGLKFIGSFLFLFCSSVHKSVALFTSFYTETGRETSAN